MVNSEINFTRDSHIVAQMRTIGIAIINGLLHSRIRLVNISETGIQKVFILEGANNMFDDERWEAAKIYDQEATVINYYRGSVFTGNLINLDLT